jgi:hypothetical protein
MPSKPDGRKMASFRLSTAAQGLLEQTAEAMTRAGPLPHTKTDVLELAIHDFCGKTLKKLQNRIDNVKT